MNGCCEDKKYGKGCTPETCMSLPEGKTCGGCFHWIRCETFGYSESRGQTACSFFPRRFLPKPDEQTMPPVKKKAAPEKYFRPARRRGDVIRKLLEMTENGLPWVRPTMSDTRVAFMSESNLTFEIEYHYLGSSEDTDYITLAIHMGSRWLDTYSTSPTGNRPDKEGRKQLELLWQLASKAQVCEPLEVGLVKLLALEKP